MPLPVALALDILVPQAGYEGSLTADDQAAFDELNWLDDRPKPSWSEIEAAMNGPAPITIPQAVSSAQAKIALHRAGILPAVKTAVSADPELEIWFTDANVWERANQNVIALGEGAMALTPEQIDELFITAAQIAA